MNLSSFLRLKGISIKREALLILLAAVLIGAAAGYAAIGFRFLIRFAFDAFLWPFGLSGAGEVRAASLPWYGLLLLPVAGGLLLGPIIHWVAWEVRGSGIPEVMEAIATTGGVIRKRVALVKAVAVAISLGSGFSVGREGPIVQIGASLASTLGQFMRASVRQLRTLVACGAAAGIAATFNTPFAGALFAIEVILGDFGTAKIGPIVVSSIVGTVVSHHYIGDFPAIRHVDFLMVSRWELLLYLGLGLVMGAASALFIRAIHRASVAFSSVPVPSMFHPAVGGLVVGFIAMATPHVFGVGYAEINRALTSDPSLGLGLASALALSKLVATSVSVGSGASGGVFAPSLFVGATAGFSYGLAASTLFPSVVGPTGSYALVGMGAFVAGATRAPITATLMIFEMTKEPTVILPLMAACIPAVLVSSEISRESIYHVKLVLRGVKLDRGNIPDLLRTMRVSEVMRTRVPTIPAGATLGEVIESFLATGSMWGFVVDQDRRPLGVIKSPDLRYSIVQRDHLDGVVVAVDLARPIRARLSPDDPLSLALQLLSQEEVLPVVDSMERVVGDVVRSDIIEAYTRLVSFHDLPGLTVDAVSLTERLGEIDLGEGYVIAEIQVPAHAVGKSLGELDIRRRFGLQVIVIRRKERDEQGRPRWTRVMPTADERLREGDFLLVMGHKEDIHNIKRL